MVRKLQCANGAGHAARWVLLSATLVLISCGGGQGMPNALLTTVVDRVDVVLVENSEAAPALVKGSCVIFTPKPGSSELIANIDGVHFPVFRHIGQSLQACIEGRAQPYLSEIPANAFFHQLLGYQRDGQCLPAGAVGCYSDGIIQVVRANISARVQPGTLEWTNYEAAVMGHETWHAVDLCFHGC